MQNRSRDKENVDHGPKHVAVIMDGNGRWARQRALPRSAGHKAGVAATRRVVEGCGERGIEIATLFAFSSENWQRPDNEIAYLIDLFVNTLDAELPRLQDNEVRLRFIGNRRAFPEALTEVMAAAERDTAANSALTLVIAMGYGGRWDIMRAAERLAADLATDTQPSEPALEERFRGYLELGDLPDPDLLIRTGGERRISNFLLWHLAYSELYFTDILWPDFDLPDLDRAIDWFSRRERRFGGLSSGRYA